MRFQAGIQILLIVISLVIVFTVIKPKFDDISYQQNEMITYQSALNNIGQYNQRLQTLINQAKAMNEEERSSLMRYLPEEIDAVAVGRDIVNIAEQNGLLLMEIEPSPATLITTSMPDQTVVDPSSAEMEGSVTEGDGTSSSKNGGLYGQKYKLSVVGGYDSMKDFLKDIERNAYPLRLVEFSFEINEEPGQLQKYEMTLETYALKGKTVAN